MRLIKSLLLGTLLILIVQNAYLMEPTHAEPERKSHQFKSVEYSLSNLFKMLNQSSENPPIFSLYNDRMALHGNPNTANPCYYLGKHSELDCKNHQMAVQSLHTLYSGPIAKYDWNNQCILGEPHQCHLADVERNKHYCEEVYDAAAFSDDDIEAKTEAIKIMGCKFKIHIQVKPEYLISFIQDFAKLLCNDPRFHIIESFKFISPEFFEEAAATNYPIVVVYLPLFFAERIEDRCAILNAVINAINNRYHRIISQIAWTDKQPHFSYKINDLIYIAGSEGRFKLELLDGLAEEKEPLRGMLQKAIQDLFTPDLVFVKGFEYIQ